MQFRKILLVTGGFFYWGSPKRKVLQAQYFQDGFSQ
jgi:hypothetical protein